MKMFSSKQPFWNNQENLFYCLQRNNDDLLRSKQGPSYIQLEFKESLDQANKDSEFCVSKMIQMVLWG